MKLAESAYIKAMKLNPAEPRADIRAVFSYYNLLTESQRIDSALQLLLDGITLFPSSAQMHKLAGQIYEQQGVDYQAASHYRSALRLAPEDQRLRQRLKTLENRTQR